jgi:3-methylcrotonyl-CoA carboxylase alpha subunit
VGAGTVEFLVDPAQAFYFMEMNTRLQVEHPVTELITGIDLVEWQLRIARGEPLPLAAEQIVRRGAALEVRLYAEDPAHDYLPSVGSITHLRWPQGIIRLDVGVDAGDSVSPFYDPMLGKIIAWGESRDLACDRVRAALSDLEISGVTTNRALLVSVLADPVFRAGGVATNFLDSRHASLAFGEPAAASVDLLIAALWYVCAGDEPAALWSDTTGWRLARPAQSAWRFGDTTVRIEKTAGGYRGRLGEAVHEMRLIARSGSSLEVEIDGRIERANVAERDGALDIFRAGALVTLRARWTDDTLQATGETDAGSLVTPLPGTIVAVHVEVGRSVERGAPLVTLEAMKMEHTVTAPHAGTVERLPFAVGDRVAAGSVLVELKAPS